MWDESKQASTHLAQAAEGFVKAMPYGEVAIDHIKLNKQIAVSQDTIATFKDVNARTFSFSFEMTPSNKQDSIAIRQIIDFFRWYSLPEYSSTIIHFPSIFHVSVSGIGDVTGENYFQFKPMALINMSVAYGEGNYLQLMSDNVPAKVKLDLQFNEVTKPYKDDFDTIFSKK